MSELLNKKHFKTILNFSRKVSKGVNSDDLSQHVILALLQKDEAIIKSLIENKNIDRYIWQVVKMMFFYSGSVFNIENNGTYLRDNYILYKDVDFLDNIYIENEVSLDVYELIDSSDLTDKERMYINAYIDSGCNYSQCSKNLDIHHETIKKYVKRSIEKCRLLQLY